MSRWRTLQPILLGRPRTERALFGLKGRCGISKGDLLYVDRVLAENEQWKQIVELGTGSGLTSLYLATCMHLRGGRLFTWDHKRPAPFFTKHWPVGVAYTQADIYEQPAIDEIRQQIALPNTFAIFDGGYKTQELELFLPSVAPGGGAAVHDWGQEVDHEAAHRLTQRLGMTPFMWDWAEACLSRYRCWIKSDEDIADM